MGVTMATPRNLRILPSGRINGLQDRRVRGGGGRVNVRTSSGAVVFLGGCVYAVAYLVLGISGFTTLSGILAIGGTGLIIVGLRKTWERT